MNRKIVVLSALFLFVACGCKLNHRHLRQEVGLKEDLARVVENTNESPFGVLEFLHWNHSWNKRKYPNKKSLARVIALMKEAEVGIVRVDFLWSDIEPLPDKFKFDKYDRIVELLDKNNISILGILHYSVNWASSCGKWNCPPKDNKVFINYAVKVIERYKGRVKFWELWNEPDSAVYWSPQDGLKSYCALLKEFYPAAKNADPGCKILNGGLANGLLSVNKLYDNGMQGYFDIMNIHFFESPLRANAIKSVVAYPRLVYKVMSRNGDGDKKIWITEIGCPGVAPAAKVKNWWLGKNPGEEQQAAWSSEVYTHLLKDEHVEKIFWAFFRDTNKHWGNGVDHFGLVRWDFSRKPAFFSYKKCYEDWKKSRADK